MSDFQTVAAIDIGTTKIVVVAGTKDETGRPKILGVGKAPSKGVVRGAVQNVGEVATAIKNAVTKCKEASGISFKNVFVGIAGQNIRTLVTSHSMSIKNDMITQDDINALTQEVYNLNKEPGEEIIHVIPQSYSVDNQSIGLHPVGCTGRRLDGNFYVIIGQANAIQKIKQAIYMAGLNVVKMVLQPIASGDAVLTNDDKEVGALVADIGGGTTDIAIYHDNVLRSTAVIPFGGSSITSDIKTACQLLQRQAEQLKEQYASALAEAGYSTKVVTVKGSGRSDREISLMDLSTITNARLGEIIAGIAYEIEKSGYKDNISEIVVTGGCTKLKSILQLMKFTLNHEVRVGRPRGIDIENFDDMSGVEYSTAAGLLMKGIEYMETYNKIQQSATSTATSAVGSKDENSEKKQSTKEAPKKEGLMSKFKKMLNDFFSETDDSKI